MIHKGDTIRLKASFYTFADVLADPTSVTAKVYDKNHVLSATLTPVNESTGVYHADYTTVLEGTFSYEFAGTLESKTILSRSTFIVGW